MKHKYFFLLLGKIYCVDLMENYIYEYNSIDN